MRSLTCLLIVLSPLFIGVASAQPAQYNPDHETKSGTELVAVYVGSPTCGPCKTDEYKALLRRMKVELSEKADTTGREFVAVGVSKSYGVKRGIEFLFNAGKWDEIVVGQNWHNSAVSEHIWTEPEAKPSMPQVIIYEREVKQGQSRIDFGPKEYQRRITGGGSLKEWLEAGAPLTE